ncbi:hypothetical protein [Aquipuribacter sp. MA13-6]|uniref:hypothetical protein n=1 Tax=unclassified Aquipuribacter TaxID=2635084 RepID=UPI003EF06B8C
MTPLVLAVAATAVAAVVLACTWTPLGGRLLLRGTARRADLAPPVHDRGQVVRRLQERTTAATSGLLLGLWVAAVVVPPDPAPGEELVVPDAIPLAMGAGFVGMALAAAAYALLAVRRAPDSDAPRVARTREVRLGDYVNGLERWSTVVACLVPTAVGLVLAVLLADPAVAGVDPLRIGLLALVPPALLVLSLAAGGVVLNARRTVSSPEELAWDDALRSQALRDIVSMPMYAGLVATLGLGLEVARAVPDERIAVGLTGLWVMLALGVLLVLLVVMLASRPARHFRLRLWPVPPAVARAGARP